jgi:hypothetical protein
MGTQHNYFPVANGTTPYWRSELHEIDSHQSTKQLPSKCDVLIIGAVYQAFLQLIIFLTTTPLLHPLCSWKLEKFAPEQQGGMVQVTLISQWQLAEICKVAT